MTITAPARTAELPGRLAGPRASRPRGRRRQWFAAHPAWPVTALLAGYPVWWAFGMADASDARLPETLVPLVRYLIQAGETGCPWFKFPVCCSLIGTWRH